MQQSLFAHPARPQKNTELFHAVGFGGELPPMGCQGMDLILWMLSGLWQSVAFAEQKAVESWNMIKHASLFCHCVLYWCVKSPFFSCSHGVHCPLKVNLTLLKPAPRPKMYWIWWVSYISYILYKTSCSLYSAWCLDVRIPICTAALWVFSIKCSLDSFGGRQLEPPWWKLAGFWDVGSQNWWESSNKSHENSFQKIHKEILLFILWGLMFVEDSCISTPSATTPIRSFDDFLGWITINRPPRYVFTW